MVRFGLPQALLLLAGIACVAGCHRLWRPDGGLRGRTGRALLVWLLLFASGVSAWLVVTHSHL